MRGDPVDLATRGRQVVARGMVNYDAVEIPALMGRSTRWLASRAGAEYEREVVHRDDLSSSYRSSAFPLCRQTAPALLPASPICRPSTRCRYWCCEIWTRCR